MPPVATLPFSEAIYNQLPAPQRKKLAQATVKQSAFSSASLLSNTLKNPEVVKALPQEAFGSYINKNGQIKWWPRLKLTLRHFYHALFSNYAKLSQDFAKLVERLTKANGNGPAEASTGRGAASSGAGGNRGAGVKSFVANMAAAAGGNMLGNQLSDWHQERKDKKAQSAGGDGGDAGDSAVDKMASPEDAEKSSAKGHEDQEAQEVAGNDGEAEGVDGNDNQDDNYDAPDDLEAGDPADDSDGGGLFGWLGGLFGGDSDGDGGDFGGDD